MTHYDISLAIFLRLLKYTCWSCYLSVICCLLWQWMLNKWRYANPMVKSNESYARDRSRFIKILDHLYHLAEQNYIIKLSSALSTVFQPSSHQRWHPLMAIASYKKTYSLIFRFLYSDSKADSWYEKVKTAHINRLQNLKVSKHKEAFTGKYSTSSSKAFRTSPECKQRKEPPLIHSTQQQATCWTGASGSLGRWRGRRKLDTTALSAKGIFRKKGPKLCEVRSKQMRPSSAVLLQSTHTVCYPIVTLYHCNCHPVSLCDVTCKRTSVTDPTP